MPPPAYRSAFTEHAVAQDGLASKHGPEFGAANRFRRLTGELVRGERTEAAERLRGCLSAGRTTAAGEWYGSCTGFRAVERFSFDANGEAIEATVYTARKPLGLSLLLGPGSDGTQRNPFIVDYATELGRRGVLVVTYDFPYAAHGAKKPDRNEVLKASCRAAIVAARECRPKNHLFVGGKSLAARISTQVVADGGEDVADVLGVVALGFPLHAVGRPDVVRDADLRRLSVPAFVAQGTRDVFGTPAELGPTVDLLPGGSELFVVPGGDHSFAVTAREGPQADVRASIADAMVQWMQRVAGQGKGQVHVRAGRRPIAPRLRDQLRSLRRRAT